MFDTLTQKLTQTIQRLTGTGRLTEENIREALEEVRKALLEADVALSVVDAFIAEVRVKAVGHEVLHSVRPGDMLVKIVHDALLGLLGDALAEINLNVAPPAVILLAGLQGSGKTTTTAKLAVWLKTQKKKKVMVVSTDVYRPAAIDQLKTLAHQVHVEWYPSDPTQDPVSIVVGAMQEAKKSFVEVLLVDTAGRLHIDPEMMAEIRRIHQAISPIETLFVVDSMTGQDAANTAKVFHETLPLTGVILTKVDGDARGGAALSIRSITGKPIKFVGVGEKMDALEPFYPDRMTSRILGMGDILSLVEEAQRKVDHQKAAQLTKKLVKGKEFDLEDFREQLEQMAQMGGLESLIQKLPGQFQQMAQNRMNDQLLKQMKAIIDSMTRKERRYIHLIKGSHKRRIAQGSGTTVPDVNRLLKQFSQMQKMMKKMQGSGMLKMMARMKQLMPGGFPGF